MRSGGTRCSVGIAERFSANFQPLCRKLWMMPFFTEIKCCRCGEPFCLENNSYAALSRNEGSFHCPWGHKQHFTLGESETDKLRRERDQLKQRIAYKDDMIREAEERAERERRRANGYKGHATRITKRAKAGVCPCCNRTFKQLAAHMANKHPEFTPMALEDRPPEGVSLQ